jgi:hypothetical protein
MPLAEWICIRPGAPTPAPFFFPYLSSTTAARPSFPAVTHMSHYANSSGGARARSRVQGCWSSRNHSIGLEPVGELSGFPLVSCPDCGMARVVEYLQMLKDAGVIVFRPSNWADAVDEVVDSVECQIGSGKQRQALRTSRGRKHWRRRWTMRSVRWTWLLWLLFV